MDTITHSVIGACLGEAIAGKQMGKKGMLWGAVANNIPDIDVIAGLFNPQTKALLIHRGITHSILFAVLMTPILAIIFNKKFSKYNVSLKQWLVIFGSGLFLHIFLDALTTYGTGWFEPFNRYRVGLNTIFIIDPLFSLPVLIATIALLLLNKNSEKRKKWWKAGVLLSALYLLFTFVNKIKVNDMVEKNLAQQQIKFKKFMATPTPLNNLLWYVAVDSDPDLYTGYYSLFDKDDRIEFEAVQKNDSLLGEPCDQEQVRDLKRFAQDYYCAILDNDTVVFSDMRFGQTAGWYKKNSPFIFNFRMAIKCSNRTALQKGRFRSFEGESFRELIKRIGGKK